jgi:N-methylhydantoinase B
VTATNATTAAGRPRIDPVDLAVMANRFDGIVREMENTLLRAARSSVIGLCRDFSCAIVSAADELIASAEGLPVHVYGAGLVARDMRELHPDLAPGDAFLHNDPYMGNTHAADHTILVPVFVDGRHRFTAAVKAHQADIGNAIPTTYCPNAEDVYAEGALIFPCVRIQRGGEDVADVIRLCRRRIRVPDVWYGDYLAMVAAGRIAERRLGELCAQFGAERVDAFVEAWLDYGEHRTRQAIRTLPSGRIHARTQLDPFPAIPDGLPLQVTLDVDADRGHVTVDLRDNPDCIPAGFNLTEATSRNAAVAPILMVLNTARGDAPPVPLNAGSFRAIEVLVREGCIAGIPVHPVSCSMATGEVGVRVWAMVMTAFAGIVDGLGSAHASFGGAPYLAVISGDDPRPAGGGPYVTQLLVGTAGGPGTADTDGWLSLLGLPAGGLLYRDSVEVLEQKYPMLVTRSEVRVDSEGAGRRRGAPGNVCEYGPTDGTMRVFWSLEGVVNVPEGVRGGGSPQTSSAYLVRGTAFEEHPDVIGAVSLGPGDRVGSRSSGGGGDGSPLDREPARVLWDVQEGYVSVGRASEAYGVVLTGDPSRVETLAIDESATAARRAALSPRSG